MKLDFQCSILKASLVNSEEIRHDSYSKGITLKKCPNLEFCTAWLPQQQSQILAESQTVSNRKTATPETISSTNSKQYAHLVYLY